MPQVQAVSGPYCQAHCWHPHPGLHRFPVSWCSTGPWIRSSGTASSLNKNMEGVMMAGVESKTDNKHLETSCLRIYQLDLAVNLGKSIHPLRFSVKLTFYSISLLVIFLYEPLTTRKWWTRLTVFIFYHDADCTTFPSIGFFQHISRRPSCTAQCTKMHLF